MVWFLLSLIAAIFGVLLCLCRPHTIHDGYRSGYVIVNRLFGTFCYGGRIFRIRWLARRRVRKLNSGSVAGLMENMFEVQKLV